MSYYDAEELIELKKIFAVHLTRYPNEPFKAAILTFPDDNSMGNRVIAANEWPHDSIVIITQCDLTKQESLLPTKEELAHEIYKIASNGYDPEIRLKAYEMLGKVMGFVKTGGGNTSLNIQNNNNQETISNRIIEVMQVTNHGDDDDWERKLAAQQKKLISVDINVEQTTDE